MAGPPAVSEHDDCPCGLGEPYGRCCGRFHAGAAAPTAELLMRARYSAYAVFDADYLLRTWHASTRPTGLVLDPRDRYVHLRVSAVNGGGLFDAEGTVEFRADYTTAGRSGAMRERSRFVRESGRWMYVDGDALDV